MNDKMTVEQALQLIDEALSQLRLDRNGHILLGNAMQVIQEVIYNAANNDE